MAVACLGLFGPSGSLPDHYTSLVIQRLRQHDFALRDFLDLFNHRTISLFYRAWEKYRFTIAYERPHRAAGDATAPGPDLDQSQDIPSDRPTRTCSRSASIA